MSASTTTRATDTFTMTEDHIRLLRSSYVSRELSEVEYGAAEIDPKRPYGNSDVPEDLLRVLGWDEDRREEAERLHQETPTALQIVLCTGSFTPGLYRKTELYGSRSWQLVDPQPPVISDEAVSAFLGGDNGIGEAERVRNGLKAAAPVILAANRP